MSPALRRLLALIAALSLAAGNSGCSSKDGGGVSEPPITQEAADDLMQQFAMSFALDNGGWQVDLESSFQSTPRTSAQRGNRMAFAAIAGFGRGMGTLRDTAFTRAGMSYSYHYLYTDFDSTRTDTTDWYRDSLATWSPLVIAIQGRGQGDGTIDVDTTFSGDFRHVADELHVVGAGSEDDTLVIFGSGDDSLFTTFRPAVRGGNSVYYIFTAFTDLNDIAYLKDGSNPYPVEGNVEAFVFADHLGSANPADLIRSYSGELRVTFDGTQTPMATFSGEVDDPAPPFRYRINLRTGAITRI